jgi:hypothetical protein
MGIGDDEIFCCCKSTMKNDGPDTSDSEKLDQNVSFKISSLLVIRKSSRFFQALRPKPDVCLSRISFFNTIQRHGFLKRTLFITNR